MEKKVDEIIIDEKISNYTKEIENKNNHLSELKNTNNNDNLSDNQKEVLEIKNNIALKKTDQEDLNKILSDNQKEVLDIKNHIESLKKTDQEDLNDQNYETL
jgi:hypothetical protein